MPSATPDSWNNPLISPPPPSPAMVGTRYRDTSPSADPDYEARYPEAPVSLSEPASPVVDIGPSPISRQSSTSQPHHRSESVPKTTQKKKRVRATSGGIAVGREGGEDTATPRLSRSQHRQPAPGYNNVLPLNYYPPPPQYQSSLDGYNSHGNGNSHPYASTGGYSGPGYYYNSGYGGGTNNSYPPPLPPLPPGHIYPPPPRVEYESSYYGNSYTPTHLPHPNPSPPLVAAGKLDFPTSMEPGLEFSKKVKSRSQEGLSKEYYETDKEIPAQKSGTLPMGTIASIDEAKEVNGKQGGEYPENEGFVEKEKEDIRDKNSIPMSHSSSCKSLNLPQLPKTIPTNRPTIPAPRSPRLPPPQYRPTGYPLLAKTLSTTPSLQLYRRFSTLNHLVLLHLQDEISELENVLSALDEEEYAINGGAGLRARRGMGTNSRRLQVMGAIAFKLQQYSESARYLIL